MGRCVLGMASNKITGRLEKIVNGFRVPGLRLAPLAIVLLLFSGCGGNSDDSSTATGASGQVDDRRTIGVTLLTMQDQFYQDLRSGLEEEAEKLGYRLVVVTAEKDSTRQANQIDDFLVQGVDAIVVCPCDSRSIGSSILAANEANVPVVTADIASLAERGEVASHIASDNRAGGALAAKLIGEALKGTGKVAILSHPEVVSVTDRVTGFREGLESFPDIEIVTELATQGRRDVAMRSMEDLLQSTPDLNGVFGINDSVALGALAAIEAAGRTSDFIIVGYDGTPEAREAILAGKIYGDVVQHPYEIGTITIRTLHDLLQGKEVPKVTPVDVGVITKEMLGNNDS